MLVVLGASKKLEAWKICLGTPGDNKWCFKLHTRNTRTRRQPCPKSVLACATRRRKRRLRPERKDPNVYRALAYWYVRRVWLMRPIGDRQVNTASDSQEQYLMLQDCEPDDIPAHPRDGVLSSKGRLTLHCSKPLEAASVGGSIKEAFWRIQLHEWMCKYCRYSESGATM